MRCVWVRIWSAMVKPSGEAEECATRTRSKPESSCAWAMALRYSGWMSGAVGSAASLSLPGRVCAMPMN
jgi:hypothetical protein